MNELDSTVASLALDNSMGALTLIDEKPAVPGEAREHNHSADIQISPDGRFLYGSNRGHDSIAVVAVNRETGMLTHVEYAPCGGATPRNLCLTPAGRHLFSANQNADRISIFARDEETGRQRNSGKAIEIGTPMCVKIAGQTGSADQLSAALEYPPATASWSGNSTGSEERRRASQSSMTSRNAASPSDP